MPYVPMCQRAFRAYVPSCQHALRAYMLTCQCALRAYMPTCLACLRANVPCVLTCSPANVSCVFTCSRVNVPCVVTCSSANVPTCSRAITTNNKNKFSVSFPYIFVITLSFSRRKPLTGAMANFEKSNGLIFVGAWLWEVVNERREMDYNVPELMNI